jgi:hypothetical protein
MKYYELQIERAWQAFRLASKSVHGCLLVDYSLFNNVPKAIITPSHCNRGFNKLHVIRLFLCQLAFVSENSYHVKQNSQISDLFAGKSTSWTPVLPPIKVNKDHKGDGAMRASYYGSNTVL